MKFKGYYHEKEENFPMEQLLCVGKDIYWIRVDSKKQSDMDTSGSFYDEGVGADICLFPSYIIELTFTVLLKNPEKEKFKQIIEDMKSDREIIQEREDKQWEEERAEYKRKFNAQTANHPLEIHSQADSDKQHHLQ